MVQRSFWRSSWGRQGVTPETSGSLTVQPKKKRKILCNHHGKHRGLCWFSVFCFVSTYFTGKQLVNHTWFLNREILVTYYTWCLLNSLTAGRQSGWNDYLFIDLFDIHLISDQFTLVKLQGMTYYPIKDPNWASGSRYKPTRIPWFMSCKGFVTFAHLVHPAVFLCFCSRISSTWVIIRWWTV